MLRIRVWQGKAPVDLWLRGSVSSLEIHMAILKTRSVISRIIAILIVSSFGMQEWTLFGHGYRNLTFPDIEVQSNDFVGPWNRILETTIGLGFGVLIFSIRGSLKKS